MKKALFIILLALAACGGGNGGDGDTLTPATGSLDILCAGIGNCDGQRAEAISGAALSTDLSVETFDAGSVGDVADIDWWQLTGEISLLNNSPSKETPGFIAVHLTYTCLDEPQPAVQNLTYGEIPLSPLETFTLEPFAIGNPGCPLPGQNRVEVFFYNGPFGFETDNTNYTVLYNILQDTVASPDGNDFDAMNASIRDAFGVEPHKKVVITYTLTE